MDALEAHTDHLETGDADCSEVVISPSKCLAKRTLEADPLANAAAAVRIQEAVDRAHDLPERRRNRRDTDRPYRRDWI
jgi:hypothetical protein